MNPFCRVIAFAYLSAIPPAFSEEPPTDEALLATLRNSDMAVRIEALRELQTSLDPRLPDALLPLLSDEGNSIRRLAARGVGSRWWQIPAERIPVFTKALAKNAASDLDDEKNMAARGLGLLKRDYKGPMFARSANKRWVVYERCGLPCLIDTTTDTEELLGWDVEHPWLSSAWGNGPLEDAARWHPDKARELCVFSLLLHRKASTLWIWRHGKGLLKLEIKDILKPLGMTEEDYMGGGGLYADFKEWTPGGFSLILSFTTVEGDAYTDHTVVLEWLAASNDLRILSKEETSQ